jgi:predicted Zn-dependent peptidase
MIKTYKSKIELSGLYLVFSGSAATETNNKCAHHLMEHLLCKALDDYKNEFQRFGLNFNAFTSNNKIVFYITGLDDIVLKYYNIFLSAILKKFSLPKDVIEKEIMIVLEEYSDYFNMQQAYNYYDAFRKNYGVYYPIGEKSDIAAQNFDSLSELHQKTFSKPTQIILVSQNPDSYKDLYKYQIGKEKPFKQEITQNYIEETNTFKDSTKTAICLLSPIIEQDFVAWDFIASMMGDGLNSPLMDEIREKMGMAYGVESSFSELSKTQGCYGISVLTNKENQKVVLDKIKEIITDYKKYLTKERFDVIYDSYSISERIQEILLYKSVHHLISYDEWNWSKNKESITYDKVMEIFDKYKFEDYKLNIT